MLLIFGACSKQDWSKKEDVPFRVASNMDKDAELGNNALHVDNASINITSIHIEGSRLQGDDISLDFYPNMVVDMKEGSQILSVQLPIGTYDQLEVTVDYSGDDGMINAKIIKTNGNQDDKIMDIPLEYENVKKTYDVLEDSDKELVSIGESALSFSIDFDLQNTLEGVGNGPWNGLITANQAQNNVDLTSIVGQNFLTKFKDQLIDKTQLRLK